MQVSVSPPGGPCRIQPLAVARALLAELPEEQRLALAGELIRDAVSPRSRLQLRSLARLAQATEAEIERDDFVRRAVR